MENTTVLRLDANSTVVSVIPLWAKCVEMSYLSLIAIIGIPGNILILIVQTSNRHKSSTDYLVITMAIYELICSSFNAPIKIIYNTSVWPYMASDIVCRIHAFLIYILTFSPTYLLGAIAVDRYVKTCRPLSNICDIKASKIVCVLMSLVGLLAAAPSIVTYEMKDNYICDVCTFYRNLQYTWDQCVTTSVGLVILVFAFSYFNIAVTLNSRIRKRKRKETSQATSTQERNSAWKLVQSFQRFRQKKVTPSSHVSDLNEAPISDNKPPTQTGDSKTSTAVISQASNSNANTQENATRKTMAEQTLNRTTRIMALLTMTFVFIWGVTCVCVLTEDPVLGDVLEKFSDTFFLLNCTTNPVVFFCMSSKYRKKAKSLICRR